MESTIIVKKGRLTHGSNESNRKLIKKKEEITIKMNIVEETSSSICAEHVCCEAVL